jgi:hypothetical protein
MPEFRYKTFPSDDQPAKSGQLKAPSSEAARLYLEKKGHKVEWIRPLKAPSETLKIEVTAPRKTIYGRDYDPGPYRPSMGDYWKRNKPPAGIIKSFLAIAAIVGVVVLFATWGTSSKNLGSSRSKDTTYRLSITGKIRTMGDKSPVQVTVQIPDIPFQQTWDRPDLDGDWAFEESLEFQTRRPGGYCAITVSQDGKDVSTKRMSLQGTTSHLDLGTIAVE